MRYYIIFGVTLVLLAIILFVNPFLGVYKNEVNIEYDKNIEGYTWDYELKGDSLSLKEKEGDHYVFKANKNGVSEITFRYSNEENTKYTIYYKFRVLGKRIYWVDGLGTGLQDYPNPY